MSWLSNALITNEPGAMIPLPSYMGINDVLKQCYTGIIAAGIPEGDWMPISSPHGNCKGCGAAEYRGDECAYCGRIA